jgi:ribosome biogenesis GTPase A
MNIQWFPGHMAKTRKLIAENLKLVDVVIELLDARIPESSRNPEIDKILGDKPRIVVLNKSDMADQEISKQWENWYNLNGYTNIFIDSIRGKGFNQLKSLLKEMTKEKIEREKQRGRRFRPIRTMVVGIPNVGKSTFVNRIAGRATAATGDRPGVTRNKQWIRLSREIELLDTPGILWPKFQDLNEGLNLAFTGAIKDDVYDIVQVASALLQKLSKAYPDLLKARYKLNDSDIQKREVLLKVIGINRGCLIAGGEVDTMRIAAIVLDEFRGGKIGKITLERPSE